MGQFIQALHKELCCFWGGAAKHGLGGVGMAPVRPKGEVGQMSKRSSEVGVVNPLLMPPTLKSCSMFVSCVTCEAVRVTLGKRTPCNGPAALSWSPDGPR